MKRKTYEEIKEYIESKNGNGCKLITTKEEFENIRLNEYKQPNIIGLNIMCGCKKEVFNTTINAFRGSDKKQCNICGMKIRSKKRTLNSLDVKNDIEKMGYSLINEYENVKGMLFFKDLQGYIYAMNYSNFKKCQTPVIASKNNPYSIQNIKLWLIFNNKHYKLLSGKYTNAKKKLKFQCLKEGCEEIFEANWNNISSISKNYGCSFCSGHQVGLSNCLATKNPELAKEWHPTKNGSLTPYDVTCGNDKEVWWQCKDNPKHEWCVKISSRNVFKTYCPYCSGHLPSEDYNLLVINPILCEEWDYEKNDKNPDQFTPNSNKYVWWKCKDCGNEWESTINNRNNHGCPECSKSKGEKECKRIFDLWNLHYTPQKTFDGLIGLGCGLLSYDFYLPEYNLLIEYQGKQHERYIKGFHKSKKDFERQKEHDRRKKEYALKNRYNFLEIWYWDFDNIEEILDNYFKKVI